MRMERIKPHLRFRNLNCFGRLPNRVKDLCNSVIDKIGVQRNGSFGGNRCPVKVTLADYVICQFGVGFGKVRIELLAVRANVMARSSAAGVKYSSFTGLSQATRCVLASREYALAYLGSIFCESARCRRVSSS